jgi:hypothetical protein
MEALKVESNGAQTVRFTQLEAAYVVDALFAYMENSYAEGSEQYQQISDMIGVLTEDD